MAYESDAEDTRFLRDQDIASLLAKYGQVIDGRCIARIRTLDAEDVAQNVRERLLAELRRGKTYPVPFRVVVHQIIGWTIAEHFQGKPTDVPLPETWEPTLDDDSDAVISRYHLEDLLATLPGKTRQAMTLRYIRGLEPAEIAAELEIDPNAVHQLLHNGHKKLRETWTDG